MTELGYVDLGIDGVLLSSNKGKLKRVHSGFIEIPGSKESEAGLYQYESISGGDSIELKQASQSYVCVTTGELTK